MRPRPLHRPTRTTAAQNRLAACVPRGSAADRARLSDRAGRGVPPAGATALPAPSRLEIYRAASASFCRRTPPRQNSPDAASICLRHNTGQILPNPEPETGLFQRILKGGSEGGHGICGGWSDLPQRFYRGFFDFEAVVLSRLY